LIYFVAGVSYLFGRNVIPQFLNRIIGALTPIVILELGLLLYDRRVSMTAMLLTAFFPRMIFWSAALYKDPAVMLAIAANILAVFRLRFV
jgi:4-amino-4-deoxy-L-arabinose transferase-like glycosyltransferase